MHAALVSCDAEIKATRQAKSKLADKKEKSGLEIKKIEVSFHGHPFLHHEHEQQIE